MADDQTLLAHLAPRLGDHPENIAVEALGYILSTSKEARSALDDVLGSDVASISRVRTQVGDAEGSYPDLAGFDGDGMERVLIEAKFWAGLTERQPVAYLKRLEQDEPSVLLFVAPAARIESLWAELRTRVGETDDLELGPVLRKMDLLSAASGYNRRLMLTSWPALLRRIGCSVPERSQVAEDVQQLLGLCERMDKDAFLPLRSEELGAGFPRRMRALTEIVRDAVERGCGSGWADRSGLGTGGGEDGWGPYFLLGRVGRAGAWLGWSLDLWAKQRETPVWLVFAEWQGTLKLDALRPKLVPLLEEDPPGMIDDGHRLLVPVSLPVGVEEAAVLDAVVARLETVVSMISESEP